MMGDLSESQIKLSQNVAVFLQAFVCACVLMLCMYVCMHALVAPQVFVQRSDQLWAIRDQADAPQPVSLRTGGSGWLLRATQSVALVEMGLHPELRFPEGEQGDRIHRFAWYIT